MHPVTNPLHSRASTRPLTFALACLLLGAVAASTTGCSGATGASPQNARASDAAPLSDSPLSDSPLSDSPLSQSPVADALYRCITARGWQVTLTDDGAIQASSDTIPSEQYQLYLADTWACNTEVSARFPVDDGQKHLLYSAELAERQCLQNLGYSVDEPPSLQQFLDDYDSAPWSAMASSELATLSQTMSEAEWTSVNRSCPQPVPGALH